MLLLACIQTIWIIESPVANFLRDRNFHTDSHLCTLLSQPQLQKIDLGGRSRVHTISTNVAAIWLTLDLLFRLRSNVDLNPRNRTSAWLRSYGILDHHYLASV